MCGDNQIKQLDFLPCELKYLDCSRNYKLYNLDNLPNSLIYFICMDCQITKCDNLPKKILFVSLYRNNLEDINNLPPNLNKLDLCRNIINKKKIKKISKTNPKIEIIFE